MKIETHDCKGVCGKDGEIILGAVRIWRDDNMSAVFSICVEDEKLGKLLIDMGMEMTNQGDDLPEIPVCLRACEGGRLSFYIEEASKGEVMKVKNWTVRANFRIGKLKDFIERWENQNPSEVSCQE